MSETELDRKVEGAGIGREARRLAGAPDAPRRPRDLDPHRRAGFTRPMTTFERPRRSLLAAAEAARP